MHTWHRIERQGIGILCCGLRRSYLFWESVNRVIHWFPLRSVNCSFGYIHYTASSALWSSSRKAIQRNRPFDHHLNLWLRWIYLSECFQIFLSEWGAPTRICIGEKIGHFLRIYYWFSIGCLPSAGRVDLGLWNGLVRQMATVAPGSFLRPSLSWPSSPKSRTLVLWVSGFDWVGSHFVP